MTDRNDNPDAPQDEAAPLSPIEHAHAPFNVIATFGQAADARKAIEALEKAGIDGTDIALHGVETTTEDSDVDPSTRTGPVGRTGLVAAVAGGVGSVVGAVIGVVILGDAIGTVAAAAMGVVFIGGMAAVIGAAWVIGLGRAWHDTFLDLREGDVSVGVHTTEEEIAEHAASVLESRQPDSIRRYRE